MFPNYFILYYYTFHFTIHIISVFKRISLHCWTFLWFMNPTWSHILKILTKSKFSWYTLRYVTLKSIFVFRVFSTFKKIILIFQLHVMVHLKMVFFLVIIYSKTLYTSKCVVPSLPLNNSSATNAGEFVLSSCTCKYHICIIQIYNNLQHSNMSNGEAVALLRGQN